MKSVKIFSLVVLALISQLASARSDDPVQVSCTKADQSHLTANNHKFAEALYDCSGIGGLDTKCFNRGYPGMTEGCVGCYSHMTKCSVRHCAGNCMWDPRGTSCRDCSKDNCGERLEKCIGLPFANSPDFDRS